MEYMKLYDSTEGMEDLPLLVNINNIYAAQISYF